MKRADVGTVVKLMAFSNGALKRDPPDGTTIGTLFQGLRQGSACSGADAWPADTDAGAVTAVKSQLALLCRYAQPLYDKAVERDLSAWRRRRAAQQKTAATRRRSHLASSRGSATRTTAARVGWEGEIERT